MVPLEASGCWLDEAAHARVAIAQWQCALWRLRLSFAFARTPYSRVSQQHRSKIRLLVEF